MIDNICALSTPWGKSALALVRVSGPKSKELIYEMAGVGLEPRSPSLCILRDSSGTPIDEALVTFFKAPNSYSGEDLVEISVHGNPIIVEKLIAEIVSRETFRLAEPGEFTRRALANNKVSLDQVESLDWVLNASSLAGVRLGLKTKIAGLLKSVESLSNTILEILSTAQAFLDFSEEEVGLFDEQGLLKQMTNLCGDLEAWAASFDASKYLLDQRIVVLAGPPNSGKSSLFNRLIGLDKAIVFDQPGTTRDFIEHSLYFEGVGFLIMDTAGIRDSSDPIEKLGIERTLGAMARADVICWVDDLGRPADGWIKDRFLDKEWLNLYSKSDIGGFRSAEMAIAVSAVTGDGVNEVKRAILPRQASLEGFSETPLTSRRQRALVGSALQAVRAAMEGLEAGQYLDMVTEQLQVAVRSVHGIVDTPNNEEVLGQIFSRFCIGK